MFIHVSFADGSNPYVRYCKKIDQVEADVKRLSENYELTPLKCTMPNKGYFFSAKSKGSILDKVKGDKKFIWEK